MAGVAARVVVRGRVDAWRTPIRSAVSAALRRLRRWCVMVMMRMRVAAAQHRPGLPPLAGEEIEPERGDQRKAARLEELCRVGDRHARHVEERRHQPDDADGDQRLHERREEGDRHAAPDALLVRDEIGGDHHLAVARPGRMHDAVEEGDAAEPPEGRRRRTSAPSAPPVSSRLKAVCKAADPRHEAGASGAAGPASSSADAAARPCAAAPRRRTRRARRSGPWAERAAP